MLSGAPPPTLNKSLVARHNQTWRLHEYHLLLPEHLGESAEGADALEDPRYKPLSPGDPLRAYLPHGLAVEQDHENDGIRVHEPGRVADTFYHRCPEPEQITAEYAKRIREILIKGQVSAHQQPSYVLFLFLGLSKAPVLFYFLSFLILHRGILRGVSLSSLAVFALAMGS
jgi:hypothetical protein